MKNVLITGGAGYIGSHVAVTFVSEGYNVSIVDNYSNSCADVIYNIEKITNKKVKSFESDITDSKALFEIFKIVNPEIVVHLAGKKSISESINKPLQYYNTNVVGTLNVLQAMDAYKCKQIIFSSTATVYGPNSSKCAENADLLPKQPYGKSKLMCESLIEDWHATDTCKKAVVFRYFNPLGAHESKLIGENSFKESSNIMPLLLNTAVEGTVFKIYGNDYDTDDGTGVRDYIHVMDIASAHIAAAQSINTTHNIYNLGTGNGISVLQLLRSFEQVIGFELNKKFVQRRLGDIPYSCADATNAYQNLKWTPEYDLEKMCLDSWEFMQKKINSK